MDADLWQDIQAILDQIFDLPPTEQESIIKQKCEGKPALEKEVRSFLTADAQSNALFNQLSEPIESDLTVTVMQAAKTFEQYEIIQKIGIGGMGVVYKVWDKRLERHIALKYLSPKLILDESVRKQFKTEARAASRIDHPNICAIYDIGESTENQLYFTMPFYTGKDLGKTIADTYSEGASASSSQQSASKMAGYALQIAAGLAAAHAEEILHRDIKPGNIMITQKGVVKILDFGIAKIVDGEATTTQFMAGSTAYMSPEQTLGYKLDQRADIWSFGVVLYEMFSSQLPFAGADNAQITQAILAGNITPISTHPQSPNSKTLARLIDRTLQPDLNERCRQITELFPDLQRLQSELNDAQLTENGTDRFWAFSQSAAIPPSEYPKASLTKAPRNTHPAEFAQVQKASPRQGRNQQGMNQQQLDQQTFLNARPQRDAATPQAPAQKTSPLSIPPATRDQIEAALLHHVGPAARVILRRSQRNATCLQNLCELLAKHIEPDQAKTQLGAALF